jgi:hypothetical protein
MAPKKQPRNSAPTKRQPVPRLFDGEGLQAALEGYCTTPASVALGAYRNLSRAKAVAGEGLLFLYPLLVIVLQHAPGAELTMMFLQKVFKHVVDKHPEVNVEQMNQVGFATFMSERVVTLLAHVRRLLNETKFREASNGMSSQDVARLRSLAAMVKRPGLGQREQAASPPAAASPKRVLKREASAASAVSVDSQGFPQMLRDDHFRPATELSQTANMDAKFLQQTLEELENQKDIEAPEHVEGQAEEDEEEEHDKKAAAKQPRRAVHGKPAAAVVKGVKKPLLAKFVKAKKPNAKTNKQGWKKVSFVRKTGSMEGQAYSEWIGPDHQRYRSLRAATEAGYVE